MRTSAHSDACSKGSLAAATRASFERRGAFKAARSVARSSSRSDSVMSERSSESLPVRSGAGAGFAFFAFLLVRRLNTPMMLCQRPHAPPHRDQSSAPAGEDAVPTMPPPPCRLTRLRTAPLIFAL